MESQKGMEVGSFRSSKAPEVDFFLFDKPISIKTKSNKMV